MIRTEKHIWYGDKTIYKSLLNLTCLLSKKWLSLPDHHLVKNLILAFDFYKVKK